jgi:hypothetical protein
MTEIVSAVVAGIALIISIIVFIDNRIRQLEAARLARRPTLVFAWDHERKNWRLSNIGNGPALDVVVVQRIEGRWTHPLRMPELGVDDTEVVPRRWIEQWHTDPGLAVRYRSVMGEPYLTRAANDWSQTSQSWVIFLIGCGSRSNRTGTIATLHRRTRRTHASPVDRTPLSVHPL